MADLSSKRLAEEDDAFSQAPSTGDVIAGKYRVDGVVGKGGMGLVVSAQHLQLGQKVAIKVLSVDGLDDSRRTEACARFLREGQAAARLTSDHVVRIYDVGTLDTGAPFMVMELLRGDDLSAMLDRQGPAPIEVAVDYIVQASDAVGEAHSHGIVHRDLKPSNLFVSRKNDGRVTVKVLDFGISKAIVPGSEHFEGNLTATRSVVGSPYYMSPEQVRDAKRVDTRTDVWSLGMILYELLVGEPAFNADTLPGICAAIAADTPPPIRARRPDVPPELEATILRCLEKDPTRRFQSVAELVGALQPFLPRPGATSSIDYASRGALLVSGGALEPARPAGPRRTSAEQATVQLPAEDSGPGASPGVGPALGSNPSASSPSAAASSPVRSRPSGDVAATLLSGATTTGPSLDQPAASHETRRGVLALGAVLLTCALGAGLWFSHTSPAAPVAAPPPTEAKGPVRFSLTIESVPSGATVFEGDRVLGTTPLSLTLENAKVTGSPRRLTLRLEGYEPYPVTQGPSEGSVRVLATLSKESSHSPPLPPSAEHAAEAKPAAPHAPLRRPMAARPQPAAGKPAPAPATPSDIRLER